MRKRHLGLTLIVLCAALAATGAGAATVQQTHLPLVVRPADPSAIPPVDRALELEVLRLLNERRVANGLPPLAEHSALTQAARRHANDMAASGNFSHTGTDGSSPEQRVRAAAYPGAYAGEILAFSSGYPNKAEIAVQLWMNSPPHRAIVLSPDATEFGAGYATGPAGDYWAVDFGRR